MDRLLPEESVMLGEICSRLGIDEEEAKKRAKKFMEERYPEFAGNTRLALFMYALSRGIEFPVRLPVVPAESKKVAQLEVGDQNVEVAGYAVGITRRPTTRGTEQIIFTLVDDTGHVHARVWGENAMRIWEMAKINEGDAVHISGAVVDTLQQSGEKFLKIFGQYVEISKIDANDAELPPLEEIGRCRVSELEEGRFAQIRGIVVRVRPRRYIGCPECDARLAVDAGTVTQCPKCGNEVVAAEREWCTMAVADDTGEVAVRVPPGVRLESDIGDVVHLMGIFTNRTFRVISGKVIRHGPITSEKPPEPEVYEPMAEETGGGGAETPPAPEADAGTGEETPHEEAKPEAPPEGAPAETAGAPEKAAVEGPKTEDVKRQILETLSIFGGYLTIEEIKRMFAQNFGEEIVGLALEELAREGKVRVTDEGDVYTAAGGEEVAE